MYTKELFQLSMGFSIIISSNCKNPATRNNFKCSTICQQLNGKIQQFVQLNVPTILISYEFKFKLAEMHLLHLLYIKSFSTLSINPARI